MHNFRIDYCSFSLLRIGIIFLFLLLQSCTNGEIGKKLSDSFDYPNDNSKKEVQKEVESIKPRSKLKVDNKIKQNKVVIKEYTNTNYKPVKIPKSNFKPQPYRIIIKLSGANPSAPAETVTNALRKSGVDFEVEKIELVKDSYSRKRNSDRSSLSR